MISSDKEKYSLKEEHTNNKTFKSTDKKILVSACLYGYSCRYDGRNNKLQDKTFLNWKERGLLVPICPEVLGGLSTPRPPSEIKDGKIVNNVGCDVTDEFEKGANKALDIAKENNVLFAIMKDKSPSCGCKHIYDGTFGGRLIKGCGITVRKLLDEGIVVLSEDDMSIARVLFNER